ncbi:MAG: tetratricopeptide repeat protein [Burkholderiales bacterium]
MSRAPRTPKRRDPALAAALRQAAECVAQRQWSTAEGICRFVLERQPEDFDALGLLAEACFAQSRSDEALRLYDRAVELRPRDALLRYNRATVLASLRRFADALAEYDCALAAGQRDAATHINRGNMLQALARYDEALRSFERALALAPANAGAQYNRANVLRLLARHEEAVAGYDRALALDERLVEALLNRGIALGALGRHEEAVASHDRALALDPQCADAHFNRGNALRALARDEAALASYDRALALRPAHPDGHWNRAWALLALGDFERGFAEHEWRWQSTEALLPPQRSAAPRWLGDSDPAGRTVLLVSEQGIGDTLQFLRYVPLLAQQGAIVLLDLPRSLARLCEPYRRWARIIAEDEPILPHDLQCSMASLPLAFRTTLQTIPPAPYLTADPSLTVAWKTKLGRGSRGPRVGLVWAGNPRQKSEPRRGVGLELCRPLFEVPGVEWFSLQVGERAADLVQLPPGSITDLSGALGDFADTAAVIANLDLVISSDTAAAHLAGALGRPVWVLLMFAPDWRWLRGRSDSPWYPGARLFRQPQPGDWAGVIEQVKTALGQMVAER